MFIRRNSYIWSFFDQLTILKFTWQVVLALESEGRVGTDVMSLDRPINIAVDEYFKLMRRQFTDNEWKQIEKSENDLHEFYRFVVQFI